MNNLSRRDLLRASATAAIVAVPMTALANSPANAATHDAGDVDLTQDASDSSAPVMFCIHDAAKGEVSILQGTSEVLVTDRRLVAQIMKVASARQNA